MVDVVEFHSKVDDYVKGLVSLDLLNKVINTVDLLYQLDPAQPGKLEAVSSNFFPFYIMMIKICSS